MEKQSCPALCGSLRGSCLEPGDQLVEAQLLQPLADCLELARGELDEALALGAELERLAQPGLVRVEPSDDLLESLDCRLVRRRFGGAHFGSSRVVARTVPSAMRASNMWASRSAAAVTSGSPVSSTRSA